MNKGYFEKATNPLQYDSENMDWKKEGVKNAPTRQLPQEYLEKYLEVENKRVLDIGCGMGQLFYTLKGLYAKEIVGIDPSERNVLECNKSYPDIKVIRSNLEDFSTENKFEAAVVVYVFEHIAEVSEAFKKIHNLLLDGALLYLIHLDNKYATTPRFDYEITEQRVDENTTALETKRSLGLMYDLIRPTSYYIEQAELNGFVLKNKYAMIPTPRFMEAAPKYTPFSNTIISHLLVLQKKD